MEKSHVEPLLEEVEPPFTKDILEASLPAKFKMPQIKLYKGEEDLTELTNTKKGTDSDSQRTGEKRKKKDEQNENRGYF